MTGQYDVAIIGYGPAGVTLANLLGLYGCRTIVMEQDLDVFPVPRAVHADAETLRIFQALGLHEAIQPALGIYRKREYFNAKGQIFFKALSSETQPFGHPQDIYFHQPTLETALRVGLDRFDHVETRLEVEVERVQQDADGVTLTVRNTADRTTTVIRARYAVGCDGASSIVRKQLDIDLRDLGFDQPWLVVDVYLKPGVTPEMANLPNCHRQYCNPRQPITFVPTAVKGHYRWEFMCVDDRPASAAEEPETVRELLSLVVDPDLVEVVRSVVYTFHALVAKHWRKRRVFIAGDAAHQMPPFAGQGMCSGLRDIHNLGWKLALVLQGAASEKLLDTYAMERIPHVTRMTRGTMFLGNLIQTRSPIRAFFRDVLFKTILRIPRLFDRLAHFTLRSPALKRGLLGGEIPQAGGTLFIQPRVQTESGETVLLDEVLGAGFTFLGMTQDSGTWPDASDLHPALKVPLTCVQIVDDASGQCSSPSIRTVRDVDGALATWFQKYGANLVVIRPDRYVFGAYTSPGSAHATNELREHLALNS